jgi:nucleotide-binding universal stress UspA family protein
MPAPAGLRRIHDHVSAGIIISYDGTPNDDDALALGKALAAGSASLALAYVRHSREFDPAREALAQHDAERRLRAGAHLLGDDELPIHVVFSASTDAGLEQLAESEGASVIVFGSDYRTAPGRAEPGNTAQRLLEGGPVAIGVAQAGLRTKVGQQIHTIAVPEAGADEVARATAEALASKLGAELISGDTSAADLIVVGSQPGSRPGHVALGGATRAVLNAARGSVLVLAHGVAVEL